MPETELAWPPTLAMFKSDQKVKIDDERDDERYTNNLAAAIDWVMRVRKRINYNADPLSPFPAPTHDHILGTIRLAARWSARTKSPDGMVAMGDLGSSRVTSFDPDIDKMLRVGRYATALVA